MATAQEQLDALKKKKEVLLAKEKELQAKIKASERKKRTKRLIEIGGMLESAIGRPVEPDEKEALLNYFVDQRAWILRALEKATDK